MEGVPPGIGSPAGLTPGRKGIRGTHPGVRGSPLLGGTLESPGLKPGLGQRALSVVLVLGRSHSPRVRPSSGHGAPLLWVSEGRLGGGEGRGRPRVDLSRLVRKDDCRYDVLGAHRRARGGRRRSGPRGGEGRVHPSVPANRVGARGAGARLNGWALTGDPTPAGSVSA